jgi:hypothetical protein
VIQNAPFDVKAISPLLLILSREDARNSYQMADILKNMERKFIRL